MPVIETKGTVAGASISLAPWEESGSPITVAGPRPICTAFPFLPKLSLGSTHGTPTIKEQN